MSNRNHPPHPRAPLTVGEFLAHLQAGKRARDFGCLPGVNTLCNLSLSWFGDELTAETFKRLRFEGALRLAKYLDGNDSKSIDTVSIRTLATMLRAVKDRFSDLSPPPIEAIETADGVVRADAADSSRPAAIPNNHPILTLLAMCANQAASLCTLAHDGVTELERCAAISNDLYNGIPGSDRLFERGLAGDWSELCRWDTTEWRGLQTWRFVEQVIAIFGRATEGRRPWRTVWHDVRAGLRECTPPGDGEWMYRELTEHLQLLPSDRASLQAVPNERAEQGKQPEGASTDRDLALASLEDLGEREREILVALLLLRAEAERRRVSRLKAVHKVDPHAKGSSYNKPIASLKKRGLIDSKHGPNGGVWLTPRGKTAAQSLQDKTHR